MPLDPTAPALIKENLEKIRMGARVKIVTIGFLTPVQLAAINANQLLLGLPEVIAEIVFVGAHIYKSRILGDKYTVEDIIDQIASAMQNNAVVLARHKMTAIQNLTKRADRYGNLVTDQAVFEGSRHHPRLELFSVIPKGDKIKPNK